MRPAKVSLFSVVPDGKNPHPLSERLASLGMTGDYLRAPLKPLDTIECCDVPRGFRGCPAMMFFSVCTLNVYVAALTRKDMYFFSN